MKMPLEGCRVLDWTVWQQGPLASMMLGDLGAEVIKIEDRRSGDPMRGLLGSIGKIGGMKAFVQRNFYFEHCNRNKKSITLDLTKQKGKDIIYKLVEKSDVFIQNYRKGVAVRLGLDYNTLRQYNPRLIYATASGWGPKGPDVDRPSFDFTGVARSGIMTVMGEPGMPPVHMQAGIADQIGGIMTAYTVVTSLYMREKTGVGQEVEASMLGGMVYLLGMLVDYKLISGVEQPKWVRATAGNPLWNYYKCKDDKWLVLGLLQSDRYWPDLCRALGIERLEKNPRFADMNVRGTNAAELVSILDSVFITKTRAEWQDILSKHGDLLYEPINTITELVEDPQVRANDYVIDFQHPSWGKVPMVGFPMHFRNASASVRLPVPEFGQHTEEVLQEVLGYTWEEITTLKAEEVI